MKRLLILFFFLLASLNTPSAYLKVTYIPVTRPINYYDKLIEAIIYVESRGDTWALNLKEQACGAFQITPIRVKHYNELMGSNYKTWDFFDYELSRKMFLDYTKNRSFQKVAKSWNGSGDLTKEYWRKGKSESIHNKLHGRS